MSIESSKLMNLGDGKLLYDDLRKRKADIIISSASGAIASFSDGADNLPLEDIVIQITPVQDLHGYDCPWPAGGGVNQWDEEVELGGINSSTGIPYSSTTALRSKNYIPVTPGASYYMKSGSSSCTGCWYDAEKNYISTRYIVNAVMTAPDNAYFFRFDLPAGYGTTYNHDISINYPSSNTSYYPYSNICPISGWTGANVYNMNAIYPFVQGSIIDNTGADLSSTTRIKTDFIPYNGETSIALVVKNTESDDRTRRIYWYDSSKTFISSETLDNGNQSLPYTYTWFTAPTGSAYFRIVLQKDPSTEDISPTGKYLEINPVTYPISWQTEAGTVYGGTWNPKTGVLTVDRAVVDLGTLDYSHYPPQYTNIPVFYTNVNTIKPASGRLCKSSAYKCMDWSSLGTRTDNTIEVHPTLQSIYIADSRYETATDFKLAMSGVQLVYELATPLIYQLIPSDIRTLYGQNHIFADTGSVSVDYCADTKMYVNTNEGVKDVKLNGTSVVDANGNAIIPAGSTDDFGVVRIGNGLKIGTDGKLTNKVASDSEVKGGTYANSQITPSQQHKAVFYGLAKLAGADMASSSNAVGVFTDAAKIAIQKMLGLYEAPWEMIREDTFTTVSESDYTITVDGNSNPFELTDIKLLLELPNVESSASKGYYGQIWFYYGDGAYEYLIAEPGAFSRNAGEAAKGCWYFVDYKDKMVMTTFGSPTSHTNAGNIRLRYMQAGDNSDRSMGIKLFDSFSVNKIVIKSFTGTGHFKLYGKRKWT